MRRIKKIALALLIAFIVIQFIQPAHNKSEQVMPTDFAKVYAVPANVQIVLQNACYDCHSNNTNYPWYSNIQPMAWIMARHIRKGKEKLNFSDFGNNSTRKQVSKLKEIISQVKDDDMPLSSYKLMHKKARLSQTDRAMIMDWMQRKADSLSTNN